MTYLQLWQHGNMVGYIHKPSLEAAQRAAYVIAKTGEYHPVIIAPRTEKELANA